VRRVLAGEGEEMSKRETVVVMPKTVSEARFEAMGIILALIDNARSMRPSKQMTISDALDQWADMCELAVVETYGDDWRRFAAMVRGTQGAN
jgi:hypothetical protein